MTKEELKAYKHQYYLEHRDMYREYYKNYKRKPLTREQKVRYTERTRRYYARHREQILAHMKEYYIQHRDEIVTYQRAYREFNKKMLIEQKVNEQP